jgi:hypothetical protein
MYRLEIKRNGLSAFVLVGPLSSPAEWLQLIAYRERPSSDTVLNGLDITSQAEVAFNIPHSVKLKSGHTGPTDYVNLTESCKS